MSDGSSIDKLQLSEFQLTIATKALRWCLVRHENLACSVEGKSELFIVADCRTAKVCIYSDGFDIKNSNFDIRFEPDDILSLEHAQELLWDSLNKAS